MLRRIPPKNMEVPRALPVGLHEDGLKKILKKGRKGLFGL